MSKHTTLRRGPSTLDREEARFGVDLSDSHAVARAIRTALSRRSSIRWSVTCGRGTVHGSIYIDVPKSFVNDYVARAELFRLLGCDGHVNPCTGHMVFAARDYRAEYLARARGEKPVIVGVPYWD